MLFKNDSVGAVDVVIDPTNSQVVYATLWNTRRPVWYTYQPTNGPGGGIYKSTDGGTNWTQLTSGLPQACIGRSGIAVAPSNPRRVYAIVDNFLPDGQTDEPQTGCPGTPPGRGGGAVAARPPQARRPRPLRLSQGGLYRSDDAGATWTKMSTDAGSIAGLSGRGWYFEKIAVDPKNADVVYVPNVATYRSKDGGRTWVTLRGSPGGDDYHQAWVSPDDPNTMILASDQGAIITRNALADNPADVTWSSWLNQPTAQIYHVSADYRTPYWVTGAQQDSGAVAVRSRGKFAGISMRDWEPIGPGGESGSTAADPLHPAIVFGFLGNAERWDLELNSPAGTIAQPQSPEPARADWTQPLVFSKAEPHALYYANQFLFKTTDDMKTWTQISPDLTRPDPGVPANLDAVAAKDTDRNGNRGVIYTIAPSPLRAPLIWIGTDDGLIQVTSDDRQDVAERDAGGGHVLEPRDDDRGVALRRQRSLRVGRSPSAHRFQSAHLSHARHGQVVAGDHARAAGGRLRARREGRSGPARLALRRHGAQRLDVVRRRRQLAVAAAQSAGHVDARLRDPRRRSDPRDARARASG